MALNIVTFKTRALTSLIFVAIMAIGLLWNEWSFLALVSVIHFGCWYEWQRIAGLIYKPYQDAGAFHRYGIMIAGWCLILSFTEDALHVGGLSLRMAGAWAALAVFVVWLSVEILRAGASGFRDIGLSLLGLVYISVSLSLFTHLRFIYFSSKFNLFLVVMVIGSLWINDTMAYLVGSFIGKTPFTKISPKKTWEGTLGGIVLSILSMGAIGYWVTSELDWESITQWMIVAAICSVMGTLGDLFESKLKRMANLKDSGQILPGHGGFLDRFDSLLFAAPGAWFYIALVTRGFRF